MPTSVSDAIRRGYEELRPEYGQEVDTAVRSSATREDSELASFAGQYESYLNVRGPDAIVERLESSASRAPSPSGPSAISSRTEWTRSRVAWASSS